MSIPDLAVELATLKLGDKRLEARARKILPRIGTHPTLGFPQIFGDAAEIEAYYRFIRNPRVTAPALLAPHEEASWKRAQTAAGVTLVIHDTTECSFSGAGTREGLVQAGKNRQTFYAHFALAVGEGAGADVYGVVGLRAYTVENQTWVEKGWGEEPDEELLSGAQRWQDLAAHVHHHAPAGQTLIHVMDREADDYAVWTVIREPGDEFVIRSQHDRCLADEQGKLHAALADEPFLVQREVALSARGPHRPPKTRKSHPDRSYRMANLSIRAGEVEIRRPAGVAPLGEASMRLSVVEVVEVEPPEGEVGVRWLLLSTLPIDTPEAVCRIVDIYRKRWVIEEFNKALKTGCAFEKRQAESLTHLLNTLALLVPVAWRLLVLRALARQTPTAAAQPLFDEVEVQALRTLAPKAALPKKPTVRQVMMAVATLGGHLKANGEPGWLVLGRGLERLLEFAAGWRAALDFFKGPGIAGGLEM